MNFTDTFEDIRPFNPDEIEGALQRIAKHPLLDNIIRFLFPNIPIEGFREQFLQLKTTEDFQVVVMDKAIKTILERTSSELIFSGAENLEHNTNYLFLANHRDILLDSALLQVLLDRNDMKTSEITFGSNLMKDDLVIDVGRMNKMFRIDRESNFREFYRNSIRASQYMRFAITEKHESVWIAQRNGRTKDGNDQTEIGVLKMLAMGSDSPFVENLTELNIAPLSISYEYEPCDFLKTREIYISRRIKYLKATNEDLNSILKGITQWKGRIELAVAQPVTQEELIVCAESKDKFKTLSQLIDWRIYRNYKFWPNNYIAYDLLINTNQYNEYYTEEDSDKFITYMNDGLKELEGDKEELREIFLQIYANPVKNGMR